MGPAVLLGRVVNLIGLFFFFVMFRLRWRESNQSVSSVTSSFSAATVWESDGPPGPRCPHA